MLLFEQWSLNAGFLIPEGHRKDLAVQMFFTGSRQLRLLIAPTNRARTIIMKAMKFESPVILLRRNYFRIPAEGFLIKKRIAEP